MAHLSLNDRCVVETRTTSKGTPTLQIFVARNDPAEPLRNKDFLVQLFDVDQKDSTRVLKLRDQEQRVVELTHSSVSYACYIADIDGKASQELQEALVTLNGETARLRINHRTHEEIWRGTSLGPSGRPVRNPSQAAPGRVPGRIVVDPGAPPNFSIADPQDDASTEN